MLPPCIKSDKKSNYVKNPYTNCLHLTEKKKKKRNYLARMKTYFIRMMLRSKTSLPSVSITIFLIFLPSFAPLVSCNRNGKPRNHNRRGTNSTRAYLYNEFNNCCQNSNSRTKCTTPKAVCPSCCCLGLGLFLWFRVVFPFCF